jgi:hypothetical protein
VPDFGFVGAAYEAPSIYQDAQECINFYPEIDPTKAQGERGIIALYPTPGLETVAILPNQQEVRGNQNLVGWNASIGHLRPICLCDGVGLHAQDDWAAQHLDRLGWSC